MTVSESVPSLAAWADIHFSLEWKTGLLTTDKLSAGRRKEEATVRFTPVSSTLKSEAVTEILASHTFPQNNFVWILKAEETAEARGLQEHPGS
ncbi:hypothetical protein H920_12507 [Fukomys damarensis]|uniref:Uncharacterized protein n=1 Tax=Fukomys damarensis TaxID=885580 RepID=A0A091DTJ2_FUKDA|nr:hypothetical protein H920_12507 [Fukomys damarensis]